MLFRSRSRDKDASANDDDAYNCDGNRNGAGVFIHLSKIKRIGGKKMRTWKEFLKEEDANGVVEVILILVVLIGVVVIFRKQLQSLVKDLMQSVEKKAKAVE